MKKYITAILAATLILSLASCGNNNDNGGSGGSGAGTGDSGASRMGNAATDIRDGIDNAATDMTDGTMFDTDKNYNVDDYTGNAPGITK